MTALAVELEACASCAKPSAAFWLPDNICSACRAGTNATPAATADDTPPKVDTTAAAPGGRSTSAGVASMCLSGSHGICKAAVCSCHCHGGPGRSEAA